MDRFGLPAEAVLSGRDVFSRYSAAILIPAYQPDETLVGVISELRSQLSSFANDVLIVVVNDGSTLNGALAVFEQLASLDGVVVLAHAVNKGKGAALKTGIEFVLVHLPSAKCIVTADADGQHEPIDILRVLRETVQTGKPVLGVRSFDGNVPPRSRFGNSVTRRLFKLVFGQDIIDTQTGLRGIPVGVAKELLSIKADRYNFEFEALVYFVRHARPLSVPIKTVYEPGNPTSHFNPLLDSARIYAVFARHLVVIFGVAVVDYAVFLSTVSAGASLLTGLLIARSVSLVLYFVAARKVVFRSHGNVVKEGVLFLILVALNILLLWPLVSFLNLSVGIPYALAMPLGNILLFGSNFLWQNAVVFSNKDR